MTPDFHARCRDCRLSITASDPLDLSLLAGHHADLRSHTVDLDHPFISHITPGGSPADPPVKGKYGLRPV